MALTHEELAAAHGAPLARPGLLRLALTLTLIAAGYIALAWDTLPGFWPW